MWSALACDKFFQQNDDSSIYQPASENTASSCFLSKYVYRAQIREGMWLYNKWSTIRNMTKNQVNMVTMISNSNTKNYHVFQHLDTMGLNIWNLWMKCIKQNVLWMNEGSKICFSLVKELLRNTHAREDKIFPLLSAVCKSYIVFQIGTTSRDISGCHNSEVAISIQWVEARGTATHRITQWSSTFLAPDTGAPLRI